MTFDPTLSLGTLVNAVVLLIGFVIAFARIGGRIDLLSQRLSAVEEALKAFGNVTARLAVIEALQGSHAQMIAALQKELSDVRHGDGFVRGSRGIDREYP